MLRQTVHRHQATLTKVCSSQCISAGGGDAASDHFQVVCALTLCFFLVIYLEVLLSLNVIPMLCSACIDNASIRYR